MLHIRKQNYASKVLRKEATTTTSCGYSVPPDESLLSLPPLGKAVGAGKGVQGL